MSEREFTRLIGRSLGRKLLFVFPLTDAQLEHSSVTDPAEPDLVDYSPLPSENLASPVPREYFDFTQLFLCFPSDCAVRIENPSVFLQTNKPTKK